MNLLFEGWTVYIVPLVLLSGPMWFFGRVRVRWSIWDFSTLLLPFLTWSLLCLFLVDRSKDEMFVYCT